MRLTRWLPFYLIAATVSAVRRRTPGAWATAAALWLPPGLLLYLIECGVPAGIWDAMQKGQGAALALAALMLGPLFVGWLLGRASRQV